MNREELENIMIGTVSKNVGYFDVSKMVKIGKECTAIAEEYAESKVSELKAEIPKWISVEERMPEYDTPILAHTLKGSTFQCSRDKEIDLDFFELYIGKDEVTHWMPLPQPPQK
jgi:hypothetical protein